MTKEVGQIGNTEGGKALTPAQFGSLAEVSPEPEWLSLFGQSAGS
jgi:hypothetical protein